MTNRSPPSARRGSQPEIGTIGSASFADLIDAANLGLLHYEHERRRLVVSRQLAAMLDLTAPESHGDLRSLLARLPRRDRHDVLKRVRGLVDAPEALRFTTRFVTGDGEIRHAAVTLIGHRDTRGRFVGASGLVADDTRAVRLSETASQQFSVAEAYFNNSPVPTMVYERIREDEFLVEFNRAADRLTRGGIRDLVGQPSATYTRHGTDEFRAGIIESVRDCLASEGAMIRRFSFYDDRYRHSHTVVEIAFCFAPPNKVIAQIHDLTEIMTAYNRARRSERDYRTLAENAPVGIFRTDADGGVRYANPRLRALLPGVSQGERIDGCAELRQAVSRCLEQRSGMTVRHPVSRGRDGPGWLETHLHAEQGPDGTPGVLGITTDVTADVLAASVVEKREQQLRSVFDNLADAVVIADDQGRIRIANDAFCKLSGYSRQDLDALSIDALMPDDVPGDHGEYIAAYRLSGHGRFIGQGPREVELLTRAGDRVPVELAISEGSLEDEVRFIAAMRDLRERKAAEERQHQIQKMEALGQLTGGIAHDFNNVLSIIKGNVEMIAHYTSDMKDDEIAEFIDNLELAIDQGTGLTSQLLSFSRQDHGEPEALDVGATVRDAVRLLTSNLGRDIELVTYIEPELWPTAANRNDLLNVLVNLVLNSRDAMPEGGTVWIRVENEPTADAEEGLLDHVKMIVQDTGMGMDQALVEKVCEPFFTTKEAGHGTGLGLSMAQAFAIHNGGQLTIDSEPGCGTTVTLRLPRGTPAAADETEHSTPMDDAPRVLVVERDEALASFIVEALRRQPDKPCVTADARRALNELAGHKHVSALVSNVLLPHGVKGVDVALAARKLHPDVACVFISAGADRALTAEARNYGPVLSVPLSESDLLQSISRARQNDD